MIVAFYVASSIALLATGVALTRSNAVHGLLFFIVSLLALAVDFSLLGAPFVAALEVLIYAGAIMVLFLFVIMLLGLGPVTARQEREWMTVRPWMLACSLAAGLLVELFFVLARFEPAARAQARVSVPGVAANLCGPYVLVVELASMLLLAGLGGAFHIGSTQRNEAQSSSSEARGAEDEPPSNHSETSNTVPTVLQEVTG